MTRSRAMFVVLMLVGAGAALAGRQTTPAATLFQQGLLLERAEANVAQAIVVYERAIADYPKDPAAPQIIAHLAAMYERRNDPRAERMWTRLRTDYAASPYAAEARKRAATQSGAGPFPTKDLDPVLADLFQRIVSPDGRSALTWRENKDADELWVRDLGTGRERKLFSESGRRIERPFWSHDSRRVLFLTVGAAKAGEAMNNRPHDVRLVTVQTGQSRTIAASESGRTFVNWSPNSRWIFLQVGALPAGVNVSGDIRVVDVTTGEPRKLFGPAIPTNWFAWSADSRQIAFETSTISAPNATPEDSFWIASVETGQVKPWKVPLDPANGRINIASGVSQRWTPDGRVLVRQVGGAGAPARGRGTATTAGARFYLVPVAGGPAEQQCVVAAPIQCNPYMTPDGRIRLAMDNSTNRIVLFDLARKGTPIRITEDFAKEGDPRLSDDGRLLLFSSNRDGESALYAMPLDRAPVSSPVRVMPLGTAVVGYEAWAQDGRLVAMLWYDDNDVYRINMDKNGRSTGTAGRLTQDLRGNGAPVVGPESKSVAFQYSDGIGVMTADGAGERPVLQAALAGHLEWMSAEQVLFQRRTEPASKTVSLASLNINTGATQAVMELPLMGTRHWQFVPSRNEVFYVPTGAANAPSVLRARSVATGADREVATIQDLLPLRFAFRVSPDGKQIAYGAWVGTGEDQRPEMYVMSIDGRDKRVLPTGKEPTKGWRPSGYPYDWSPDSRFVLYDGFPGRVMVMDVRSSESWPVPQAVDADSTEWSGAQWSPDGTFIVIERYGYHAQFRLIEGLTYDNVLKVMKK